MDFLQIHAAFALIAVASMGFAYFHDRCPTGVVWDPGISATNGEELNHEPSDSPQISCVSVSSLLPPVPHENAAITFWPVVIIPPVSFATNCFFSAGGSRSEDSDLFGGCRVTKPLPFQLQPQV